MEKLLLQVFQELAPVMLQVQQQHTNAHIVTKLQVQVFQELAPVTLLVINVHTVEAHFHQTQQQVVLLGLIKNAIIAVATGTTAHVLTPQQQIITTAFRFIIIPTQI